VFEDFWYNGEDGFKCNWVVVASNSRANSNDLYDVPSANPRWVLYARNWTGAAGPVCGL